MDKRIGGILLAIGISGASGCTICRSVEQWKCDHLGFCNFGTRPQQQIIYSTPPPVESYAPAMSPYATGPAYRQ